MPSRVTRRLIARAIADDDVEVVPAVSLRNVHSPLPVESVATILENDRDAAIQYWMELVKHDEELICIPLSFEDRMGHLLPLFADLVNRLRYPPTAKVNISIAAREHGDLRHAQGYSAAMLVEESRILEVSIFSALHNNLQRLDFSKVLLDVVTIADEVDSQIEVGHGRLCRSHGQQRHNLASERPIGRAVLTSLGGGHSIRMDVHWRSRPIWSDCTR